MTIDKKILAVKCQRMSYYQSGSSEALIEFDESNNPVRIMCGYYKDNKCNCNGLNNTNEPICLYKMWKNF